MYIKEIESCFYRFIWKGKPDKIKRLTLIGDYECPKNIPNALTGFCVHLIPLILSLQFFSLPIHIPSVLFLFRINPENDPNISILPKMYIKEIESCFYRFIWKGKPDKIKRLTLIGDYVKIFY
jgi:DNA-directed RNA polymerase subunit RPC12/RpoP